MSIEHRWTPRQPTRLRVSVECRPLGLLRGQLRNISHGGAMVRLRTPLPSNAPVELIVPLRAGTKTRSHRLPAIVTRCDESEVGLMFGRVEPDVWAAILAQIRWQMVADAERVGSTVADAAPAPTR